MSDDFLNENQAESKTLKWYEKKESDESVVISTRIRLARNLKNYPFPSRITDEQSECVISEVVSAVINENSTIKNWFEFQDITNKPREELQELLERHVISPEMATKKNRRGFLLSKDESLSVLLNEEDHVRIQSIFAGDNIDKAFEEANRIDDLIEERIDYAFDSEFGYCTSCPTNTGTGIRASFMLHLPAYELVGNLRETIALVSAHGIAIRGMHGEGSKSYGSIYQISNHKTLGRSEEEIIAGLKKLISQLVEQEKKYAHDIYNAHTDEVRDKIYRAYGILMMCQTISFQEAMQFLSEIRYGFVSGCLEVKKPSKTIYNIMMDIQNGSIEKRAGRSLIEKESDILRAKYIRDTIIN